MYDIALESGRYRRQIVFIYRSNPNSYSTTVSLGELDVFCKDVYVPTWTEVVFAEDGIDMEGAIVPSYTIGLAVIRLEGGGRVGVGRRGTLVVEVCTRQRCDGMEVQAGFKLIQILTIQKKKEKKNSRTRTAHTHSLLRHVFALHISVHLTASDIVKAKMYTVLSISGNSRAGLGQKTMETNTFNWLIERNPSRTSTANSFGSFGHERWPTPNANWGGRTNRGSSRLFRAHVVILPPVVPLGRRKARFSHPDLITHMGFTFA